MLELPEHLVDGGLDLVVPGDVTHRGHGGDAAFAQVLYRLLETGLAAGGDGNARARFAQRLGDLQSKSATAARNERHFAIQAKCVENAHWEFSLEVPPTRRLSLERDVQRATR